MGRVFVTGDTHRTLDTGKLSLERFPLQAELTREDIVIIAGDFGLPWIRGEDDTDRKMLEWHENKPYTTVFIDGNHENFDAYEDYPITEFMGAKCHRLRPHVYHIMRGEIMKAGGHTIWFFGGAISIDRFLREEHESWWEQEMPTKEEMDHGMKTLSLMPDTVITHEGPYSVITENNPFIRPNDINNFMEDVRKYIEINDIPVKNWYFGHHHTDWDMESEKIHFRILYQDILEIL